ncbi:NADPH-dependent F420 reductase [Roseomonas sp. GCM10028921]
MSTAIIGSGAIGRALATNFARSGVEVLLANSRGPDSLAELAGELGPLIRPVALDEALGAGLVILAVPHDAVDEAVRGVADWGGRIVVDATNAIDFPAFTPRALGGRASTAMVAEKLPGAQVVKGFNTLPAALLAQDPRRDGGHRALLLSGDDEGAVAEVAALVKGLGFAPLPLGRLDAGGMLMQFGGPLMVHDLIRHG